MTQSQPVILSESRAFAILEGAGCGFALVGDGMSLLYSNEKWRAAAANSPLLKAIRAQGIEGEKEPKNEEITPFLAEIEAILGEKSAFFEANYAHADSVYLFSASPLRLQERNVALLQLVDMTPQYRLLEERRLLGERERLIREALALEKISAGEVSAATAEIYGRMSLRESQPDVFQNLAERYGAMLQQKADERLYSVEYDISDQLRAMGDHLGLLHAGSRDVMDIHASALRKAMLEADYTQSSALLEESVKVAMELMCNLVERYRKYLWLNHNQAGYEEI